MMRSRWARRGEGSPARIVHPVLFALLSLLLGLAGRSVPAAEPAIAPATVTIGVLAHRGEAFALRQWRDTLDHLQAHLPNHTFRLAPFSLPDLEQAVKVHAVDFVLTNPGHTVYLSRYYGISQFASVQAPGSRDPSRSLGSVVFVRADRDDIEGLGDLEGKRVLAVSRHAFGGYLIGWQAIAEALGERASTVKVEARGFPQDAIVTAVLAGEGDAGITRTCLLEHLIHAGRIAPGAIRVLSPRHEPRFNCQVSSELYPGWAFSAHPATSAALTTEVARALYAMPPPEHAMAFDYEGWIAPVSYGAVERLYRELDSEAFVPDLSAVIRLVVREHLEWLLFAALVLLLFLVHVGRVEWLVHKRTRQLRLEEAARSEFTERIRELEAETARAYRTAAMAEMAGGLAHELNQPISAILNYAHALSGLVARERGDPELIEQTLAKIRAQGERAAGVVRGIFSFLRNRPPRLVATDLRGLVEQALAFSELNAAKHGCRLNWNRPAEAVVAEVDEIQFQQVLIILAQNAMEASAGLPEARRRIDITLERMENRCLLRVTDRGEGLDQEATKRAFEPFFTTKSGLGLGLSVAATIVQRHHGSLSLDSVQGEGTTATVQLPIAKQRAEKGPADE